MSDRRQESYAVRLEAAELARSRQHPTHEANGDEQRYAHTNYAMSFTKGLQHDENTGLIANKEDFEAFRQAIDEGFIDAFTAQVPVSPEKERAWEAPTAGVVYELEGPDPQAVTMEPAPALGSDELAYEMAEVYELALLRDQPLTDFKSNTSNAAITSSLGRLNALPYTTEGFPSRPRTTEAGSMTEQTLFRGSSPKVEVGPYVSQFLLIGNDQPGHPGVGHGLIQYGALQITQKVPIAKPQNYLTEKGKWLSAQNGANLRDNKELFDCNAPRRFITFPRDLATYVHDDALYEAYLNACLILLSMKSNGGAPFDPGFANLSGEGSFFINSLDTSNNRVTSQSSPRSAGGFALYGGPHILTLVTEVATRALKAVRYQKFNNHIRLRPEALAGRVEYASIIEHQFKHIGTPFSELADSIKPTVDAIRTANASNTALLPMAFQEGSPMHPSYGAGHATVAGACVTILKAFFDTDAVLVRRNIDGSCKDLFASYQPHDIPVEYSPNSTGSELVANTKGNFLTLEGELNKLAANISIGRNMAGVHYYSDYFDSLRMGEQIALGILEEQALTYSTDPFVLSVPTFDGEVVRIGRR
ncbi:vanadium-dependent haloperoxidase [Leptothoe spongobia]|uniref:Vanadium-dependent haloperoxidase n=1 Tax=Leptothoe spongobia TAU-MAC 1115 TaxID=1967444 RepID=A0A947DEG6_9CYAN|nr:vanadium-dependent haloperoxidase [Leptothoe spongobia]MBT9315154.1 vanadium-dependent haloperoxidase [Leptothoe spongobia TAU-MAC 1115]